MYEVCYYVIKDFFLSLSLAVGEGIGKPTAAARGSSMYLTEYRVSTDIGTHLSPSCLSDAAGERFAAQATPTSSSSTAKTRSFPTEIPFYVVGVEPVCTVATRV